MTGGEVAALAVVALLLVVVLAGRAVLVVRPETVAIVERRGRYHRTLPLGLQLIVPFLDRVRTTVDLREQVLTGPAGSVVTSDRQLLGAAPVVHYTVVDPRASVYEIPSLQRGLEDLSLTALRNLVAHVDEHQARAAQPQLARQLTGAVSQAAARWGVRVSRVDLTITDPTPGRPDMTKDQT